MDEVITIPYRPRDVFWPLHDRTQRWACVVAHRRCGKTVACINDLIKRALQTDKSDYRGAYVAPFYVQAKAVAWDYLRKFTAVIPGVKYNEAELKVDFPNGARIQLFGADNADRLRGLFFDDLVADEYGDWKPSVWPFVIRPALADRGGCAIVIGTPKGRNSFYDLLQRAKKDHNWLTLILKVDDTGTLPQDEIDALKSELSEDAWRQEMLCDFEAALPGAYYGKEINHLKDSGRFTQVKYDPEIPVHTAWDLGYSDDTVILWYQMVRGEIHIIDCHSSGGMDVAFYAELVTSKPYNYGTHWLPHDAKAKTLASGGKSIEEQLRTKLKDPIRIVPDLSIQDGIQAVRMLFPRFWFDLKCEEVVETIAQYQREYDEDKRVFRDKPRHDWTSHIADAVRMMAVACRDDVIAKANEKPRFDTQLTISEIIKRNAENRRDYRE